MLIDWAAMFPLPSQKIHDTEIKEEVIYLDKKITNRCGSEQEIKRRIGMAKEALGRLVKIWKDNRSLSKQILPRLVKSLVLPIAEYGSESWTINTACRRRIEAFEMISLTGARL